MFEKIIANYETKKKTIEKNNGFFFLLTSIPNYLYFETNKQNF